ncbi:MAG TPA: trypsin-like serine protease [Candidatus Limnocylindria bacterium]
MRRIFFAVLTALMLATAVPAAAITYGQLDGQDHPMVGLVTFYNSDGNFIWRCSGTLLSPTVLLTAGHCTGEDPATGETPARAQVWFATSIDVGTGGTSADPCHTGRVGYPCNGGNSYGTPYPDPDFHGLVLPNSHDVGVVVLDTPQSGPFASIAGVGTLDSLATQRGLQDTSLVVVGYGLLSQNGAGSNAGGSTRARKEASQQVKDLRSALTDGYNVATTNAPGFGTGDGTIAPGGTCFGDSGGPVFYPKAGQFVVVGITSFGLNNNCRGGDYAFRTDIQETHDFVNPFLQ